VAGQLVGAVPEIDPVAWWPQVYGAVDRELELSLDALPEREVAATLQCAGNRRAGLIAIRDIPGEARGSGGTGTATWAGVALAEVLALTGPTAGALPWVPRSAVDLAEEGAGERFGVGERHHVAGALDQRVLCVGHVLPDHVADRVVNGGRL
jgi:DMSO/TMAO reductase YedYZ molybdopterin-dependent catalytic subunit